MEIKDIKNKVQARDFAIEWQHNTSEQSLSYAELLYWKIYFEKIAKKFGLIKEFKENGIL
jgi:hypothetical protein